MTPVCDLKKHISNALLLTSRTKTYQLKRIEVDPDPWQSGVAADAALPAVTLNFHNEE